MGTERSMIMTTLMMALTLMQVVIIGISIFNSNGVEAAQLSYNYYDNSCPNVEDIVRSEMFGILTSDSTASAAFLRLIFHDCQVEGCDGSILLDVEDSEIASRRNFGIRKREQIGQIKSTLEAQCPGQVSCADIIALAARESVAFAGGPRIQIPLGRRDSRTSSHKEADARLPSPRITVDQFIQIFASKGMNLEESVAIIGAHTLGAGHCLNIVDRLYDVDRVEQMDLSYELFLRLQCPTRVPLTNLTTVNNDDTPIFFDNQYYGDIAVGRGLFGIDSNIWTDPRTAPIVLRFKFDPLYFFRTFSSAFVKLSSTNVLTGSAGEVRLRCDRVN